MISIGFTGHRPNKIGGYDRNNPTREKIKNTVSLIINALADKNPKSALRFYCGGAIGFDTDAFDVAYHMKLTTEIPIEIVLAIPFKDQPIKWNKYDVEHYEDMIERADTCVYVDEEKRYMIDSVPVGRYNPIKMQKRNEYMVDHSNVIIACWDGTPGGTGNCVKYARAQNKTIWLIEPNI